MPFERPSLTDLIERNNAEIDSRLPGADPRLRRSFLGVIARMLAGASHGLHGHLDYVARQITPDTADTEYLEGHASVWGIHRKAASYARGDISVTGATGSVIPAGTEYQTGAGGIYTTDAEAILEAGAATIAVTADLAGVAGDLAAATVLSLSSPISGVQSQAVVAAAGVTHGEDAEADDALRDRLLARIQAPPHGGAERDYEAWALEVAGISRAFVFPLHLGAGTVGLAILADDQSPPVPDADKIEEVQAYIDARRPVTASVTVYAPTPVALDLTIQLVPSTSAAQAAVAAELEDLLQREATPGGTIALSHIREAISIAAGETDHVLVAPAADVTHSVGEIATLGVITWA